MRMFIARWRSAYAGRRQGIVGVSPGVSLVPAFFGAWFGMFRAYVLLPLSWWRQSR